MSVILYSETGFRGEQVEVMEDLPRISATRVGAFPGSIELTGDSDAVLLFSSTGWKGRVQFLTGKGSRANLGRSVSSIRLSEFRLHLNLTVVRSAYDKLPGRWVSERQARREINEAIEFANAFLVRHHAKLQLVPFGLNFDRDARFFDVAQTSRNSARRRWKSAAMLDVIFVNSIEKTLGESIAVRGYSAGRGLHVYLVAAPMPVRQYSADEESNAAVIARHLVEELGGFCGLQRSVLGRNVRARTGVADAGRIATGRLAKASMKKSDIMAIHDVLANVFDRKYDRLGEDSPA